MPTVSQRSGPSSTRPSARRNGGDAQAVTRAALSQLADLTGRSPDTVSAIERIDDGWRVEVELVELERVPATTNILATYEVQLDNDCSLVGYRRLRRYFRNAAEEGWS